ncbi:MAG: hypothetical protein JNM17_33230 [Archangium sp.]|nr:hypothetical protein [Archangium sp.]
MMNPTVLFAALSLTSPLTPEQPTPIKSSAERTCAVSGVLTVTDKSGRPARPDYAEVYVDSALSLKQRKQLRRMEQKGLAFVPRVLVVEKGDVVVFVNTESSTVTHEIHADKQTNTFVSGENSNPETFQKTFEHVGETHLGCNKHAFMSGTILTVPNSLHVQVEANGKWTIANVPARPLKLVVWQQTATQPSKKEVNVSACDTAVKVTLEAPIAHVTKENDKPDDAWESYVAAD